MLKLAREQYYDCNISYCLEMLTARHSLTVSYTIFTAGAAKRDLESINVEELAKTECSYFW